MKVFSFFALLAFSLSTFANVSISNPRIEVKYGGGILAVQPTAHLLFEFASCAKFDLEVAQKFNEKTSTVNLTVESSVDQMDCRGPSITRTYKLQLSSDFGGERYVVLNALVPVIK